jgi:prevent-host-death family protein
VNAVNLKEARRRLGRLVEAAGRGEEVVITCRGRRVARLVAAAGRRLQRLPDLTAFRAALKHKGRNLTAELLAQRREDRRG